MELDGPHPRSGPQNADHRQLSPAALHGEVVLDLDPGRLQHQLHVGGGADARLGGHPAHQLPGGGPDGDGQPVRHSVPHRHIHVPGVFPHLQIHGARRLPGQEDAAGVVPGLGLVSRRGAEAHPRLKGRAPQVLLKDADPVVAPGVGAQADADDHRAAQLPGLVEDVLHTHHDGAGLIGVLLVRRDTVALPVKGPGLFQLHGDDLRVRGCAGEVLRLPPRRHGGQEGAVAVLVPLGHDGVGVLRGQGGVNFRVGVLPAQEEALRRRAAHGLVVDRLNPAAAVLIAEDALGVVDAGIQEADEHPPPLQVQVGLALDLGDPRRLQGGTVQKPQHHGDGADEGGAQGLFQVVEILLLDVAQDIAPGEKLPDDHLV